MTDWNEVFRKVRGELGWTQKEVARETGVTQSYISELKRGHIKRPSAEFVSRLASVLGVSMDALCAEGPFVIEKASADAITAEHARQLKIAELEERVRRLERALKRRKRQLERVKLLLDTVVTVLESMQDEDEVLGIEVEEEGVEKEVEERVQEEI